MNIDWTQIILFILGFTTSQAATWIQYTYRENQHKKSIYTLIEREVHINLHAFKLIKKELDNLDNDQEKLFAIRDILEHHTPISTTVWESQLPIIGSTLNSDELDTLLKFYQLLKQLPTTKLAPQTLTVAINEGNKAQQVLLNRLSRTSQIEPFIDEDNQPTNHHTQNQGNH